MATQPCHRCAISPGVGNGRIQARLGERNGSVCDDPVRAHCRAARRRFLNLSLYDFFPTVLGETAELRDIFAMIYAFVYLTICFFAVKGS